MDKQVIELLIEIRNLLKDKFEPVKINAPKKKIVVVPYRDIVTMYHDILPELPQVKALSETRKGYIKKLWLDQLPRLENWENYFDYVGKSDFLIGKSMKIEGRKQFVANLEWITKPANFLKILEENYHG